MCHGQKSRFFGDGRPPTFNRESGNSYNGYINPYGRVDDHPLLYGNSVSLDPSTHVQRQTFGSVVEVSNSFLFSKGRNFNSLYIFLAGFPTNPWDLGFFFEMAGPRNVTVLSNHHMLGSFNGRFTPRLEEFHHQQRHTGTDTLPKTNIAPKNGSFQLGISFSKRLFSGAMLVSGRVMVHWPNGIMTNISPT